MLTGQEGYATIAVEIKEGVVEHIEAEGKD